MGQISPVYDTLKAFVREISEGRLQTSVVVEMSKTQQKPASEE